MTPAVAQAASRDVLDELIEEIGLPAVVRLAEAFPGVRIFIPLTLPADHPLVRAVGLDAALKLSRRYCGDVLIVPKRALRQKRNARIVAEYQAGSSARDLALRHGLHEYTVYALVTAAGAQRRQMQLF